MLKSNPELDLASSSEFDQFPASPSRIKKPVSAPKGVPMPGIFVDSRPPARSEDQISQRESTKRWAHRLHMKEFFSRA